MPDYTCDKCARVFKQKSGYEDHMNKKKSCIATTAIGDVISSVVEEKVKEAVRAVTQPAELALSTDEVERTKSLQRFFEDLHNLLWANAGLSPEKALEHMTFFFAYRLIEIQADVLGLPQECRWSYIASLKNDNDLFETIKKGVSEFRKKPKTKPFFKPHEIQKASIVFDIVRLINTIPLKALQERDTLGEIFEYMLGRGMSTMSDEGAYFTNRRICKLAFKLAYAIKKSLRRKDGSLCTFADWFCGTGGFPAVYVKGVTENLPGVDWKKEAKSIYCQDRNQGYIMTTLLNLLILTGIPFSGENIRDSNSFTEPITKGADAPYKDLSIDYCFMNPPYGGDKTAGKEYKFSYTKKEKDTTGKMTKRFVVNLDIQSIGIEDDDKVSAGVQLAMATLSADGGICCIVLPQGFFFGASKKCVELRKKIAEEYKIHFVVDIASGSFLNTGTKTSMLVFQKGVGPTEKVAFIGLDEKPLVEATLEELRKKNYSFNFKQYLPQSAVEVEGFEMVKIKDILDFQKKPGNLGRADGKDTGKYPFYTCAQKKMYVDTCEFTKMCLIVNRGGMMNVRVDKNFSVSHDDIHVLSWIEGKTSEITILYVAYYLGANMKLLENGMNGTTLKHLNKSFLEEFEIPLPSLERQQQIVEAIDGWTSLAHQEEVALDTLEKQMMFQVKEMGRGKERVKLGDIASFTFGYGIKSEDFGNTGIPIIKTKNFQEGKVSIISSNPRTDKSYDDKYRVKKGDLLMVVDGACGETAIWREDENGWLNQHVAKLTIANETTRMYVAFVMKGESFREYIQSNIVVTTIPHMQRDVAKNFDIPLPPLTEQQTLQSDFDEIRHKHQKIATYKAKAQEAIQRLIPGAATS